MTVILVFTKMVVLSRIRQSIFSRETGSTVNDGYTGFSQNNRIVSDSTTNSL